MVALGFAGRSMPSHDRVLWALRTWLDSWPGIGHVAVGMHRQGFDLRLTQYDERGWRATFYTTGMEHSPTSATGTAWKRTPWRAAQPAAWEAFEGTPSRIGSIARLRRPRSESGGLDTTSAEELDARAHQTPRGS